MVGEPGSGRSGKNTMIIVVVALLVVAAIAVWATSQRQPSEMRDGTRMSDAMTSGDKDEDLNLKADLPDSVTVEAK
ncbi:MAG TPA: hypothetical protein VI198_03460 [Candidatus Eisenbacteria bacterium]